MIYNVTLDFREDAHRTDGSAHIWTDPDKPGVVVLELRDWCDRAARIEMEWGDAHQLKEALHQAVGVASRPAPPDPTTAAALKLKAMIAEQRAGDTAPEVPS